MLAQSPALGRKVHAEAFARLLAVGSEAGQDVTFSARSSGASGNRARVSANSPR
ncbi:hypothetical protein ABZ953_16670 [Streptomyces sp. NPDC046465]|uniref:hypothetical protein n=1 Tax=Streptomyces sp. NPDC046465 TaxID=3155810 RepID=UPI0033F1074B